jgi:hypothetical protein
VTVLRWLRRLHCLTAGEVWLLLEAQFALAASQFIRWLRPTGQLISIAPDRQIGANRSHMRVAADIGWAVDRAARYGCFRPRCLVRSLAVQRMLRRRGIGASQLQIGVRVEGGRLAAHAWVEMNGVVIGDSLQYVRRFTPARDFRFIQL